MSKITELINNVDSFTYSFEVTPDIKQHELENLELEPLFFSVTWHVQAQEFKNLDIAPLKLAKYLRSTGKNVLLHISCCNMKKNYLDYLLETLKDNGICNLFIILGENFDTRKSDFNRSQDLILYIRQRTGQYFCIGVAGFPGLEGNISHLKEKVDCGVDFILTQAFFENKSFKIFNNNCVEASIMIPIIPGIFPFETKTELNSFAKLCRINVEDYIKHHLASQSGIEIMTKLAHEILEEIKIKHLHFFTLNKMKRTINFIKEIKV